MIELIIYAMVLLLVQVMLPSLTGVLVGKVNNSYLLSSRDGQPDLPLAGHRAKRASLNLQESLPVFFTLAVLSIMTNTDTSQAAAIWLIARVVYVPCYMFNMFRIRTTIWFVSIGALVSMALSLFNGLN